jgi:transketolase
MYRSQYSTLDAHNEQSSYSKYVTAGVTVGVAAAIGLGSGLALGNNMPTSSLYTVAPATRVAPSTVGAQAVNPVYSMTGAARAQYDVQQPAGIMSAFPQQQGEQYYQEATAPAGVFSGMGALLGAVPLAAVAGYLMGKSGKKETPIAMHAYSGEPIEVVSQGPKAVKSVARKSTALSAEHGLIINRTGEMTIDELCVNSIRFLAVDGVNKANSGHPGAPMGQAPMAYVLFTETMNFNPKNPYWVNRDRFVLSSGHGCMLQYAALHLTGYDDVTMKDLQSFRQWGSKSPGHPENFETRGVEVTTGPLGMGLSNAVGLAAAERHLAGVYNKPGHEIIDHYTYTIAGDGCFQEGITHEACSYAGHLKLGKLIAFYDDNEITIDGETSLSFTEDVEARYKAYGWQVLRVADGNTDVDAIRAAIAEGKAETEKPTLIMVKTVIGYGAPTKANSHDAHGAPLGKEEADGTRKNLGWEYGEFEVPEKALEVFRAAIPKGAELEAEWNKKLEAYKAEYPELGKQFQDCVIDQKLPEGWENCLPSYKPDETSFATRINSFKCLNALGATIPGFLGGSADLAPSNMTLMSCSGDFLAGQYENKNFRFGVREFGMGAVANALALHKTGLIPYCATFLIFTDYMRNAIRIAALSQAGTIFVMTHDSVALGEDGPTHQPVEIIGSLRMIPQLAVIRPCDGNETSGAYKMAVMRSNGMGEPGISGRPKTFPTLMALSRQVLPNQAGSSIDAVAKGAYTIQDCEGTPDAILIGTGSEVQLCIDSAAAMEGKKVRVVSMPCWEFFEDQTQEYKDSVLIPGVPTVSVEAGTSFGWHKYSDAQVAIDQYGASAPGDKVMQEYGMTVENVVATTMALL